jgi:hypothetical protein
LTWIVVWFFLAHRSYLPRGIFKAKSRLISLPKVLAPKAQLLNVTARPAAMLYHGTAFGIRIASLDLHLLIAGNACDEVRQKVIAFLSGLVDMAARNARLFRDEIQNRLEDQTRNFDCGPGTNGVSAIGPADEVNVDRLPIEN